jgi:hypothetical protein
VRAHRRAWRRRLRRPPPAAACARRQVAKLHVFQRQIQLVAGNARKLLRRQCGQLGIGGGRQIEIEIELQCTEPGAERRQR